MEKIPNTGNPEYYTIKRRVLMKALKPQTFINIADYEGNFVTAFDGKEKERLMKTIQKIVQGESDNLDALLEYIEFCIQEGNERHKLILHFALCEKPSAWFKEQYEYHNWGVGLGTVYNIFKSEGSSKQIINAMLQQKISAQQQITGHNTKPFTQQLNMEQKYVVGDNKVKGSKPLSEEDKDEEDNEEEYSF